MRPLTKDTARPHKARHELAEEETHDEDNRAGSQVVPGADHGVGRAGPGSRRDPEAAQGQRPGSREEAPPQSEQRERPRAHTARAAGRDRRCSRVELWPRGPRRGSAAHCGSAALAAAKPSRRDNFVGSDPSEAWFALQYSVQNYPPFRAAFRTKKGGSLPTSPSPQFAARRLLVKTS